MHHPTRVYRPVVRAESKPIAGATPPGMLAAGRAYLAAAAEYDAAAAEYRAADDGKPPRTTPRTPEEGARIAAAADALGGAHEELKRAWPERMHRYVVDGRWIALVVEENGIDRRARIEVGGLEEIGSSDTSRLKPGACS